MGGGGHGHGLTYKGLTVHTPKRWHTITGKGLCAVMWAGGILGKAMMITIRNSAEKYKALGGNMLRNIQ